MKILQTFWTGPAGVNKDALLSAKAGWLSCEYHWMSWALSCLQAKNIFGSVHLTTDKNGKQILVDLLQLPYTNVSTDLEGTLDHYHPSLWALAKIHTYSTQTEPFLHLDGDVYLWQKPAAHLLDAQLIAQNLDKNLPFYADVLSQINDHLSFVPKTFLKENFEHKDLFASNAGLIGGYDLPFFKEYCRQAFEFVDRNKTGLSKINPGSLNFIFEQYLFCQLAMETNTPVTYYKGIVDNPIFKDYIRFEDFPNLQMIHPVGGFKQYPHVCDHLAKKLRKDYPDYYYRIIDLLRNTGVNMRSTIYNSPDLTIPGLTPLSPCNTTLFQPILRRTQAVIEYLNNKHPHNQKIEFKENTSIADFNDLVNLKVAHADDRERILEVFYLESESNALLKKTYADTAAINKLYNEGINAYQQIQQTFSLSKDLLLKSKVTIQDNYIQLELGWNWKYDYLKDIPTIVERIFNQEKLPQYAILLPDVLQAGIKEYYPDELDLIIFETLKNTFTIEMLLTEMKQYFSEEEIEDDYPAFEVLIIDVVKRLLYYGLLKLV